jgi:hypothetical protein
MTENGLLFLKDYQANLPSSTFSHFQQFQPFSAFGLS